MKLFNSPEMRTTIQRLLRSQMVAKGMDYRQLAHRLHELGVQQSESNLRSKVNSGSLGAQLFIYIQIAMGVKTLDMDRINEILRDVSEEQSSS